MSFYPLFSFSEIYISVVVFDFTFAFAVGALYVNLNFFPLFFVFSINHAENLIHLMMIEHKFSTFFLNIRVVNGPWASNEEILSP
jgi:hypothetical protein